MCGFAGVYDPTREALQGLGAMGEALQHRGPDAHGQWVSEATGLGLVHRRLSILDLSPAGAQPMASVDGRFVLAFNGEIYNHLELRQQLEQADAAGAWRGGSDTETILACISAWGLRRTLDALVGMFAFALWDQEQRELSLVRDRMGEKPLYYGVQRGRLWFASELKALRANPRFAAEIDRDVLPLLLRHDAIPSPHAIYKGLRKMRPGCLLQITLDGGECSELSKPEAYWDIPSQLQAPRLHLPDADVVDQLDDLLSQAVRGQMLADVPLGAFLSGGIDSSTVVALMQQHSARPVRTFSIGTHDPHGDEAVYARAVAGHLGTEHTEFYVQPADALALIPDLARIYCEPFADISQLPTLLVSRLARQQVTVALTGDAGDELFGGYNRYLAARAIWARVRTWPRPLRAMAGTLGLVPPLAWDGLNRRVGQVLPGRWRVQQLGSKMAKLATALAATDDQDFYRRSVSRWLNPGSVVLNAAPPLSLLEQPELQPRTDDLLDWMMAMDASTYLHDDVLTKVDRAAMAYSLETRVPMLDHRVVEFALRLPSLVKLRNGVGKWPLRQVLRRYVPDALIDRPKAGFGVPMGEWLRGPLRPWAEDLLDGTHIRQQGYFRDDVLARLWARHLAGRVDASSQLWSVLMFQAWLQEQQA